MTKNIQIYCFYAFFFNFSTGCPEISKDHKWISDVDLKWSEDELYSKLTFPKSCQEACLLDSDCNGGNFSSLKKLTKISFKCKFLL